MSAIAKPCMFFSTATPAAAQDTPVNTEDIQSMEKLDIPAYLNNRAKSQIVIKLKSTSVNLVFTFADATARNTAFTAAKTLIAASV